MNLQPAVYKTAALPLSYASQNEMGAYGLPTVSLNLTTGHEAVKRTGAGPTVKKVEVKGEVKATVWTKSNLRF